MVSSLTVQRISALSVKDAQKQAHELYVGDRQTPNSNRRAIYQQFFDDLKDPQDANIADFCLQTLEAPQRFKVKPHELEAELDRLQQYLIRLSNTDAQVAYREASTSFANIISRTRYQLLRVYEEVTRGQWERKGGAVVKKTQKKVAATLNK